MVILDSSQTILSSTTVSCQLIQYSMSHLLRPEMDKIVQLGVTIADVYFCSRPMIVQGGAACVQ